MIDKKAFYQMSYGIYFISSHNDNHLAGCIVNTLTQVTSEPAKFSVAINKENDTAKTILESKLFSAMVITEGIDMDIVRTFGFQTGKDINKFEQYEVEKDTLGNPYIKKGMNARIACKVVDTLDLGTHILFIGEVMESEVISQDKTMTYDVYRNVKNGTTPKNAPSFQEPVKKTGKVAWRCPICGYIHEAEELPEDFVCPICSQPSRVFEKIEL